MHLPPIRPSPQLSLVIPTLNEAQAIGATLDAVARIPAQMEVIVVDGGSRDATLDIVRQRRVTVITAARGRGTQMHAGACAARGEVLWFVHADTHPPVDGVRHIFEALAKCHVVGGCFRVCFDGSSRAARLLTRLSPCLDWLGLCYGDATLFVRRAIYERAGGFRPFPIFEDVDLVQRLRQHGEFIRVPVPVRTSSRRFTGHSLPRTFMRWTILQLLYWAGVSPRTLGRFYPVIRESGKRLEHTS